MHVVGLIWDCWTTNRAMLAIGSPLPEKCKMELGGHYSNQKQPVCKENHIQHEARLLLYCSVHVCSFP